MIVHAAARRQLLGTIADGLPAAMRNLTIIETTSHRTPGLSRFVVEPDRAKLSDYE